MGLSAAVLLAGCIGQVRTGPYPPDLPSKRLEAPLAQVYAWSQRAARCLRWTPESEELDEAHGTARLSYQVPFSIYTRGEEVTVTLVQVGSGPVEVGLHSWLAGGYSAIPQPFDWGKNARNIRGFYAMLDAVAKSDAQECP